MDRWDKRREEERRGMDMVAVAGGVGGGSSWVGGQNGAERDGAYFLGVGEWRGGEGEEWVGMEEEVLARSLGVLVKKGKAQVFGEEGERGVKFF